MIGRTVSHYRVLEKLGQGGMGVVYRAEDTRLGRTVALKFLPPHSLGEQEQEARFLREARAAASLSHPSICTIHEIDEADGQSFIAMEFLEGQSLRQRMDARPFDVDEALDVALQIADGLAAAHRKGVVHRDIKPANVMLDAEGRVKIVDFGLAKIAGHTQITAPDRTMGTVAYMAPETVRGEPADARSDVWSLGVVLYEMLTATRPFQGDYATAVAYAILHTDPPPLAEKCADLPPGLEAVVDRAMAREPDARYADARAFAADLRALRSGTGSGYVIEDASSGPAPAADPAPQPPSLSPALATAAGALASAPTARMPAGPARWVMLGAAVLLVGVVVGILLVPSARRAVQTGVEEAMMPDERRLAVLPFRTASLAPDEGAPDDEALAAGLLETLTSNLARTESFSDAPFWVVPAGEILRRAVASPAEARQVFDANLVIDGSIQRDEAGLRLVLNLTNPAAEPARVLRSEVIDFVETGARMIQDQAYDAVLDMLDVQLRPEGRELAAAGRTTRPDANAFYLQGVGYMQRFDREENIDAAIGLFRRALAEDGAFALAYAGLGDAFWHKYRATREARWTDSALVYSRRALDLDEDVAFAYQTLGALHKDAGRTEDAREAYEKAIALDPTNVEAYGRLAGVLESMGRSAEAQRMLEEAIRRKPGYWRGYDRLGWFYYRQGAYEKALEQYEQARQLTPDNPWVYNNLGSISWYLERWDDAIRYYEKAIELDPDDYVEHTNLATLYFYQERYADAADAYEKALALRATDYRVWSYLGDAAHWADRGDRAETAFRRAIALAEQELESRSESPELLVDLAGIHARLGNEDAARRYLDQIVGLGLTDVSLAMRVGTAFELIGERDRAIDWIVRALPDEQTTIVYSPWLRDLREDERIRSRFSM